MWSWLEVKIQTMPASDYQTLFAVFAIMIPVLLYLSYMAFKRFRFMDATATSLIRSAAQGHVELKGLAEWMPNGAIVSPFSNSRCVWYHCTIDKRSTSGKRTTWTNVSEQTSEALFRLQDDTGHCIVDPEKAHVVPEQDVTWYGNSQGDYANAPRKSGVISVGSGRYRFRERLIRTATPVYALGWFRSFHTEVTETYVDRQTEDLIRQWKLQPGRYLRQYDLDRNDKLQDDEWKVVRAAARKQVLADIHRENDAQHLLSRPDDTNLPFILSALPEEALVSRKKWIAYGSVSTAFTLFAALLLMYAIRSPLPL